MKKIVLLALVFVTSISSAHAYNYGAWNGRYYSGRPYSNTQVYYNSNANWVPYAAAGLVAGALIANAYQARYVTQPMPSYVAQPTYAPPAYQQAYVTTSYAPVPVAQTPYQPQASVLYFCGANGLYYPQTPFCPSNWQVLPNY